jgi:integrin beta 8
MSTRVENRELEYLQYDAKYTEDIASAITGNTLLTGTSSPSFFIGNNGDMYLDTATSTLYGPKASGLWGSGTLLIGDTGAAGTSILNGVGSPANGTGSNGDFYIDTASNTLYGPKSGGAWSANVSLIGPTGTSILNGSGAPSNGTGSNGDFYINTAASTIYGPKTGGAWGSSTSLIGSSGTSILSGSGVPSNGTGSNGDFYINTAASTIYGPKTTGVWGSSTSLIGPTGSAGTNGYSILNGSGVPSSGTGANGDFYIDTASNALYGPKSGGVWGSSVSLIGPTGLAGTNGYSILNGSGVPANGTGSNGDFYIDTASNALYGPKAGGVWGSGTSLIGPTGSSGTNGSTILSGSGVPSNGTGANGDFYINTAVSTIYGPKAGGVWGSSVSLIGSTGTNGSTVLNGSGAPSAGTGSNGDFYIDTVAVSIYGPKTSGVWGPGSSLAGRTILNGTSNPTSQGSNGDFYINTATSVLFGPKASGTWPSGVSLVGTAGTNGKTILNGTTAPSAGLGVAGDFYINTATNTLYGPKTASWPAGFALSGATYGLPRANGTIAGYSTTFDALRTVSCDGRSGIITITMNGTTTALTNIIIVANSYVDSTSVIMTNIHGSNTMFQNTAGSAASRVLITRVVGVGNGSFTVAFEEKSGAALSDGLTFQIAYLVV